MAKIVGINILIFLVYYFIGFSIYKLNGEQAIEGLMTNGNLIMNCAFLLHALTLLIVSFLPSTRVRGQTKSYLVSIFFVILFGLGGILFLWVIDPTFFTRL